MTRDAAQWVEFLESTGALRSGHFLLSSGRHSPQYVQCARVLERPPIAGELGAALAARLPPNVDRIASPPLGALLIGYEVARALDLPFVFPEREDGGLLTFRRGFAIGRNQRVTIGELVDLLNERGAEVAAVAAIVDRSTAHEVCGMPIESILRLSIPSFEPDDCPLCADGVALSKPGSRPATGGSS